MNEADYQAFRKALEDTFISLYVIDPGSLTQEQRKQHQASLAVAYDAVVKAENKRFAALTAAAKSQIGVLVPAVKALQDDLSGLKSATQTLTILGEALGTLTKVIALL